MDDYPKLDPTNIPLSKFGTAVCKRLLEFQQHYKENREKDPESWPLTISEQEWWDSFLGFMGFQ